MRQDTLIIGGIAFAAIAIGAVFFFYNRSAGLDPNLSYTLTEEMKKAKHYYVSPVIDDQSAVTVSFTPLAHGLHSTVTARVNYLVTSMEQLSKLWKMIDATSTPPKVDFNKDAVIAVFAGKQPTAGYIISVARILDSDTRMLAVEITFYDPRYCRLLAKETTTPYQIIIVPATSLPLAHEDVWTRSSCPF